MAVTVAIDVEVPILDIGPCVNVLHCGWCSIGAYTDYVVTTAGSKGGTIHSVS